MNKRIVIVGATSSIALHCARIWAKSPCDFILLGRNLEKLEIVKNDLTVRNSSNTAVVGVVSFLDTYKIEQTVESICKKPVDIVLIAQGALIGQEDCEKSLISLTHSIEINALSPILYVEAFYQAMKHQSQGSIAVFSSVAGDRGRKSNYAYGASKGLVTRYVEGMQHKNSILKHSLKVCLIKPGPTESNMTNFLKERGAKLADTSKVAQDIVKGISKGKRVVYTPIKWLVIMFIIRLIPFGIFKKLDI